jgi:hypothetical protein
MTMGVVWVPDIALQMPLLSTFVPEYGGIYVELQSVEETLRCCLKSASSDRQ